MGKLLSILRDTATGALAGIRAVLRFCAGAAAAIGRLLWRTLRIAFRVLKPALLLLLLAAALADIYCETTGIPPPVRRFVLRRLAERGVSADTDNIRAGIVQGVVLENVVVYDGGSRGQAMVRARELRVTPQLGKLFSGRFLPRTVVMKDLEMYPPAGGWLARGAATDFETAAKPAPALPAARLAGTLVFHRNSLDVAGLVGDIGGVRVELDGRISEMPPLDAPPRNDTRPFGWKRLEEQADPALLEKIRHYAELAAPDILPPGDGRFQARFELPLKHMENGSVSGSLFLSDAAYRNVDIRSIRLQFSLCRDQLLLRQARLHVVGDQTVTADLALDLNAGNAAASAAGSLNPEVAVRLLGFSMPAWLAKAKFGEPLQFRLDCRGADRYTGRLSGTLKCHTGGFANRELVVGSLDASLAWAAGADAVLDVRGSGLSWRGVPVRSFQGSAVLAPPDGAAAGMKAAADAVVPGVWKQRLPLLRLEKLEAVLDPEAGERVQGSAKIVSGPDGMRLTADLSGSLAPATLCRLLPEAPADLAGNARKLVFAPKLPSFTCRLDIPAGGPGLGTAQLALQAGAGRFDALPLVSAAVETELRLRIGSADPAAPAGPLVERAEVRKADLVFGREGSENVSARLSCDLLTGRIQGRAEGKLYVDRLFQELHIQPTPFFQRMTQRGAPAAFAMKLEDSPLDPVEWRGGGTLDAPGLAFDALVFESTSGTLAFSPNLLAFKGVRGRTRDGEETALDLDVTLPRGDVRLNGTLDGDPSIARAFLAPNSRQSFDAIFRDIAWDPAKRPHCEIGRVEYTTSGSSGNGSWRLLLDCKVGTENATWRGIRTERAGAEIAVDIPGRVTINNIRLIIGGRESTGEIHLSWAGTPSCQFKVLSAGDPQVLLCGINPDWKPYFDTVGFDASSLVSCEGSLLLGDEARPRLRGTLRTPSCHYKKFTFADLSAKWSLEGSQVHLAPVSLSLCGGQLLATGQYDFHSDTGQVSVSGNNIQLGPLMEAAGQKPGRIAAEGRLGGSCRLELTSPKAGAPPLLNGTGTLRITQADLRALPVISKLADLVGFGRLGSISRLDATLDFAGDRVRASEFHTDGSILALYGNGDFNRTTRKLDFRVRGEMLKSTHVIPFLLRPFSWFFEAELSGTPDAPSWRLVRSLGSQEAEDEEPSELVGPPAPDNVP